MVPKKYWNYINKETKGKYDVTGLFANPKIFQELVRDLKKLFKENSFNKIVCIDALGFILGGALGLKTKKPIILIRKEGKLSNFPQEVLKRDFIDYTKTKKCLEINKKYVTKKDRVLIVDEWIETGSQVKATIDLIEFLGGKISGITAINADRNENTQILFEKYNLKPVITTN